MQAGAAAACRAISAPAQTSRQAATGTAERGTLASARTVQVRRRSPERRAPSRMQPLVTMVHAAAAFPWGRAWSARAVTGRSSVASRAAHFRPNVRKVNRIGAAERASSVPSIPHIYGYSQAQFRVLTALLPGLVPWQRQFSQSDIAQPHDSPWPQDEGRASHRYAVDELSQHCPGLAVLPLGHPPASFGIKHGPPPETVTTQISLAVQASQDATAMPPSGSVLPEPASTRHAQPPRSRVHVEVVALQVHSPLQQRSPGEQAPTPGVHAAPTTGSATQPASPANESDDASRELASST